jgi:hypothetical protein
MDISEICALLSKVAEQSTNWHAIGDLLRQDVHDTPNSPLLPFIYAFQYFYVEDPQGEYKTKYSDYAPMVEFSNGQVYPPPLTSLSEEIFQSWDAVVQNNCQPVIISRLGDLLWLKRWGAKPFFYALRAMDGYLQIAETRFDWNEIDRTFCLTRGLELSLGINNLQKANVFIEKIHDCCLLSIAETEPKPGITIRLLDPLLSLKQQLRPTDLAELLEKCLHVYSGNPWITEELLIKKAKFIGESDERKLIYEQQVLLWIELAEKTTGIIQVAHLEHALELARNYGITEKIEDIRKKIQEIPEESFDFKELTVTTQIEGEKVEKFIQAFIDLSDWRTSFSRFGTYGPPSGKYEDNLRGVEQQVQESPLRFLVSSTIIDDNNAPLKHGNNIDENKQIALVQNEMMAIQMFSVFAKQILTQICTENGTPDLKSLINYFTTSIIPSEIAENIAISFDWYFKGEYDVSAHLLIPRIESVFRIIAQKIGLVIIREPSGVKTGGVITFSDLLAEMKGRIDESWRRYFMTLLTNPIGLNLRNRVCHGLINKVEGKEAALLLHVACYLRHVELFHITDNPLSNLIATK